MRADCSRAVAAVAAVAVPARATEQRMKRSFFDIHYLRRRRRTHTLFLGLSLSRFHYALAESAANRISLAQQPTCVLPLSLCFGYYWCYCYRCCCKYTHIKRERERESDGGGVFFQLLLLLCAVVRLLGNVFWEKREREAGTNYDPPALATHTHTEGRREDGHSHVRRKLGKLVPRDYTQCV